MINILQEGLNTGKKEYELEMYPTMMKTERSIGR